MKTKGDDDPIIPMTEMGFKASMMLIAAYAAIMIANPDRKSARKQTQIIEDEIDRILQIAKQKAKEDGRYDG